jgi:hypothetical protein
VALLPAAETQSSALCSICTRIYILVGEPEKALDHLEPLLKTLPPLAGLAEDRPN